MNKRNLVIKFGGAAMIDDSVLENVCENIAELSCENNIVLVHGGGPFTTEYAKKLNIETKFIEGLRYTDEKILELSIMVLSGKVNKKLVSKINKVYTANGEKNNSRKDNENLAVGLSGIDGELLFAEEIDFEKFGFVGNISKVNVKLLKMLLENSIIPVISSLGINKNGQMLNVNADTVATKIAEDIKADKLIFMSDIKGVLRNPENENSLISEIKINEIDNLIESEIITGGMIPKINGAKNAVKNGVREVKIIDGRNQDILLNLDNQGTSVIG